MPLYWNDNLNRSQSRQPVLSRVNAVESRVTGVTSEFWTENQHAERWVPKMSSLVERLRNLD